MDYDVNISNLQKYKKTFPNFSSFLQILQDSPKTKCRIMDDYQITVIQRLPRYVLLLTDLIKNTKSDHPDYPGLSRALEILKAGVHHVNSKKKKWNSLNGEENL
eukprot:TRINITY_DN11529_c0_g1_i1.p1 TRINITY_DN11529_c0_g1~~TRINITY_DN11529_c0_g1_i1.p1  ORF type:complete len:104 (-),score=7.37 TRINITY_DN11529_c0_g1_i1:128-439(-)